MAGQIFPRKSEWPDARSPAAKVAVRVESELRQPHDGLPHAPRKGGMPRLSRVADVLELQALGRCDIFGYPH